MDVVCGECVEGQQRRGSDAEGTTFIGDAGNLRVRKLSPDGEGRVWAVAAVAPSVYLVPTVHILVWKKKMIDYTPQRARHLGGCVERK